MDSTFEYNEGMTLNASIRIKPLGEAAYLLVVGGEIGAAASAQVSMLQNMVLDLNLSYITDCVPAYTSLLVRFDPGLERSGTLEKKLRSLAGSLRPAGVEDRRSIEVPVIYGGEFGPDLAAVSDHARLSEEEVIRRHAAGEYTVAFLGFLPGFPYLLGLDSRLQCPRLASPRQTVPAGSVGIAGGQTGIYPLDSPGGWRIIGKTPLRLFDPASKPPTLLQHGDRVRFVPIDRGDLN
jgi:KipI family sensor histidine kinase inhibitor